MMPLKLAWRNLWRNRHRTLITSAAIFLAAFLAIFMRSLQEGTYDQMIQNIVGYYTGYVQIHHKGYWDEQIIDNAFVPEKSVQELVMQNDAVDLAVPRLESFALAISDESSRPAMVVGIDPDMEDRFTKLRDKVATGAYFSGAENEALVAQGLADKLELSLGDTIILLGQGYHGATAAGKYVIRGLMKIGAVDLNTRLVYLPLTTAQEMYVAPGLLTSFALDINTPDDSDEIVAELQEQLPEGYEVMDWKEMMPDIVQFIQADRAGGQLMLAVLYIVASFGILGTVLMMTAERKFEFGVLIGIGMKKSKLASTLLIETIFMSLLGVLFGSVCALPFVVYFHYFPIEVPGLEEAYSQFGFEPFLPTTIEPMIFLNQAIIVLFIAILIAIYPAVRIYRINPVKAMHV